MTSELANRSPPCALSAVEHVIAEVFHFQNSGVGAADRRTVEVRLDRFADDDVMVALLDDRGDPAFDRARHEVSRSVPSEFTVPVAISLPTTWVPLRLNIGRAATAVVPETTMSSGARKMPAVPAKCSHTMLPLYAPSMDCCCAKPAPGAEIKNKNPTAARFDRVRHRNPPSSHA